MDQLLSLIALKKYLDFPFLKLLNVAFLYGPSFRSGFKVEQNYNHQDYKNSHLDNINPMANYRMHRRWDKTRMSFRPRMSKNVRPLLTQTDINNKNKQLCGARESPPGKDGSRPKGTDSSLPRKGQIRNSRPITLKFFHKQD